MKQIDPMFYLRIIYDTGPDVAVKHFIGKTEISSSVLAKRVSVGGFSMSFSDNSGTLSIALTSCTVSRQQVSGSV